MASPYKGGPWGDIVFASNADWVCPAGVTSVSVVCIGSGGRGYINGGGGGGGLGWKNNIPVTPGTSYKIQVGPPITNSNTSVYDGVTSFFRDQNLVAGLGGKAPTGSTSTKQYNPTGKSTGGYTIYTFPITEGGKGGGFVGDGGGAGGDGGWGFVGGLSTRPGGGGAGGYLGNGGEGACASGTYSGSATLTAYNGITNTVVSVKTGSVVINLTPSAGYSVTTGGGAGGGPTVYNPNLLGDYRNGGGGVGVYGTFGIVNSGKQPGGFGSGEGTVSSNFGTTNGKKNGTVIGKDYVMTGGYFGGGSSTYNNIEFNTYGNFPNSLSTSSGGGAVRIVWPGDARNFPSDFVSKNNINISANVSAVNEGSSVAFTVTTTGYPDNFKFYWRTTDGATSVSSEDFDDGTVSGEFTIKNNQAVVTRGLKSDFTKESPEIIVFEVATGSTRGTALASSTVTVNDTSQPIVTISADKNPSKALNEGDVIEFTIETKNPESNKKLFWENIGTTIDADFDGPGKSGTLTTDANGKAKIVLSIKNDFFTENVETIQIRIKDNNINGSVQVTSAQFSVTDTSKTLAESYSISTTSTTVNEGSRVTWTITYNNVPINTIIYLAPQTPAQIGKGVLIGDANDFSLTDKSYTFTTSTPGYDATKKQTCTGSFTVSTLFIEDNKTEGDETFGLNILKGNPTTGQVVASSKTIKIVDTSKTPAPTYSISTGGVTTINESETVTFTITTTNVTPGTTLAWANKGNTTPDDFTGVILNGTSVATTNSGTVSILQNGTATITFKLKEDLKLEGNEAISLEIKNGSAVVIQSNTNSVTVVDSSVPLPVYSAIPKKSSLNEGESVIFDVTTQNVGKNATIYWAVNGDVGDSDVSQPKGQLTLNNGNGTITVTTRKDYVTERDETFYIEFRSESTSGDVYYTSKGVTIKANET